MHVGRIIPLFFASLVWAPSCASQGEGPYSPSASSPADAANDPGSQPTAAGCTRAPEPRAFVVRDGSRLLLDGLPFAVGGTNLYYLQQLFANAELGERDSEAIAIEALDAMVCLALPIVRMWAFNDTHDRSAIRTGPDAFREVGLRGLDRAVAEAKARGLRVILTLTNNWPEYGGLPALGKWIGKDKDDFFFNRRFFDLWRQYAALLSDRINVYTRVRYRDEPTIMAIEVANELRCERCAGSTRLTDRVADMARVAKALFPRHLIADGGEGFDDAPLLYPRLSNVFAVSGRMGASFHRLAAIEDLDLLSYHFYPRAWGLEPNFDAAIWIESHDRIARNAGKVAYLGEYGLSARGEGIGDDVRASVYDAWLERLFASTGGLLGFFWQLVPPGRQNSDGHAISTSSDPRTMGVVRKWLETSGVRR